MDHHNLAVAYQNREYWILVPNMELQEEELVLEGEMFRLLMLATNTEVEELQVFFYVSCLFKQKQGHATQKAAE